MKLGLIAGNGRFPIRVLEAARAQGYEVTVVAAKEEASADLDAAARRHAAAIHWLSIGQLGRCINVLKEAGVTQVVLAGQIKHTRIFGDIVPDLTALAVLRHLTAKNTNGLIGAVTGVLRDRGLEVMDSTALLTPLLARAGLLTRRAPTPEEQRDLEFGYPMADGLAGLDIGQTIVVRDRAVVAVEAMEGTDETIARAGRLAGGGTRVIKVARPRQDMRFDVPVIGLATIQAMRAAGATALSVDAGTTLVIDGPAVFAAADEADIAVVGRTRPGGTVGC